MLESYKHILDTLQKEGRFRQFKPLSGRRGCRVNQYGREMLNLTSNDYLGLAGDIALHQEFFGLMTENNILDQYGLGAASSRLLAGDSVVAHELEDELQAAYSKQSCLLFNSGYHANIGVLPALLGKGDLVLSDKLNHASIMDGMRLCTAAYKRYRHCDYEHLEKLLKTHRTQYKRVIIVSESVFSMDGDVADIARLAALKDEHDCMLYIDEAHAVGLYGENGLGVVEEQGQLENVDILVGTFGKAFASVGAYVLCTTVVRDFLINHSRSLIFTTALPPVVLNWNLFIFRKALNYHDKRAHLHMLSTKLRQQLLDNNLQTDGSTNIVPVLIGSNNLAVSLGEAMQERGYLVFPVRPPAVPEGTARFRLSLTADMVWQDISTVAALIAELIRKS